MDEVWKSVVGFEGLYEVSNEGRVRSLERRRKTVQGNQRWPGKLLTRFTDSTGYWYVNLSNGAKARKLAVHTLVLEAFVGPKPDGCQCRHLDGDRKNARKGNLQWGTPAENAADRIRHGMSGRGERSPSAKLSAEQVHEIRESTQSSLALAKLLGVSGSTIRAIRLRTNWSHQ
ncbi:NUMOD4 motif-containing HNH endonuclease [Burkholderia cepacia]|uniref:NUMOD4 motif-containing HNH endonuclease n=1 Tax=Burkholderia cepacia TaxID=292 RepID=UPI001C94254E|nr:NUMOD4 motif-containing HNH endonuclease [Burkholderia cepacia]MBY4799914.1 NUMOD4 motif-containing HNH endonuclease [Burkholderia cepacia]